MDALVDVVGAALLMEDLAVDEVVCSPLPLGRGWVECAHGVLPLPGPAVCELLRGLPGRERQWNMSWSRLQGRPWRGDWPRILALAQNAH